jgi:hypothetical protein
MFGVKSLWIILKDDMKKESQTYREEREDQKKIIKRRNHLKRKLLILKHLKKVKQKKEK